MQPDPVPGDRTPGMGIWGWMSPTELRWLRATAATMDSVVEVGSLHGRSTTALLDGCHGPVYAIDPWDDPAGHGYPSFMGSCGHYSNLRPVVGRSPDVIAECDLPDVDMVFIDGDHSEAGVAADIDGWLPKCRRIICGHDYIHGGGYPDVAVVVDRTFGDRVEVVPDTAIWFVRLDV